VVDPQEFLDFYLDSQFEDIAGLKPLPINRMMRQAGREANDFYTRGMSGGFRRYTRGRLKDISKPDLKQRLESDSSFRDEYQRQVIEGQRPRPTDKYEFNGGGGWSGAFYYERPIDTRLDGEPVRENIKYDHTIYGDRGTIPEDTKQRTMERLERTQDVIKNWDPIEASAREDYNRLRGGKINPLDGMSAADRAGMAHDLIRTIDTPINPGKSLYEIMFPTF
jgi:hypothetical protein